MVTGNVKQYEMSQIMTKPTKWHMRPGKTQISLGSAQSDQCFRYPREETRDP